MSQKYLGGVAEVAINENLIPAELLSEVSVEIAGGTRDTQTLKGKFTQPTGMFDTAMAKFTMFLPSMDYLHVIFPDLHNAGSGERVGEGNVILGAGDCLTSSATPVNIHYVCDTKDGETTDRNDVYIYSGLVNVDLSMTWNEKDSLSVEVTVYAQPDDNGNVVRYGAGNLTQDSYFDAATMATVVS